MRTTRVDATETFRPRHLSDHDRCGPQAYVQASLSTGQLLFCAHHYREFEARLRPIVSALLDDRDRLHADSSRGSACSAASPQFGDSPVRSALLLAAGPRSRLAPFTDAVPSAWCPPPVPDGSACPVVITATQVDPAT